MLPPLRARELDVELIATNIWQKLAPGAQLPPDLLPRYSNYKWPGNVRELVNVVQRRFALGAGDTWQERAPQLSTDGQSDFMGNVLAENPPYVVGRRRVIDEFERRFVAWALERCGGNVTRAANTYGIARRYLTRIKSRSA
jgi:two-component system, NtrC family, nitrogen regulation response regulator GlnG